MIEGLIFHLQVARRFAVEAAMTNHLHSCSARLWQNKVRVLFEEKKSAFMINLKLGSVVYIRLESLNINERSYLVGSLTKLSYRMYYFMLTVKCKP